MNREKELAKTAQRIFKEKGGAQGELKDLNTGKVCAIGALIEADQKLFYDEVGFNIYTYRGVLAVLNKIAQKNYEMTKSPESIYPIAQVNDKFGQKAVEHCYELLIKEYEGLEESSDE